MDDVAAVASSDLIAIAQSALVRMLGQS